MVKDQEVNCQMCSALVKFLRIYVVYSTFSLGTLWILYKDKTYKKSIYTNDEINLTLVLQKSTKLKNQFRAKSDLDD